MKRFKLDPRLIITTVFIEEIRRKPSIWNQRCEHYNSKDRKADDWREVTMLFLPKDDIYTEVEINSFSKYFTYYIKNNGYFLSSAIFT